MQLPFIVELVRFLFQIYSNLQTHQGRQGAGVLYIPIQGAAKRNKNLMAPQRKRAKNYNKAQ